MPEPANTASEPPEYPPRTIGLALSGGGYRASAFHLGSMAYLDRVGLLPAVDAISTVSGGTFTGVAYAISLAERTGFKEFFGDFYGKLRDVELVKLGLARLGGEPPGVPSGRHDLIVSMSQVYAETFFAEKGGTPYRFSTILNADTTPLKEIIFNATEFRHGVTFRFQKSATGRIGNFYFSVPRDDAANIRLSDIVAASSCFPGGFEPLGFPDDFNWPGEQIPDAVKKAIYRKEDLGPIALMDGGIDDNQGIESLLLADGREKVIPDAFIISDVDQNSDNYYSMPEPGDQGGLTVGMISLLTRLVLLACALTVALVGVDAWERYKGAGFVFWDLFRYLIPLFLAGATAFGIWWGRRTLWREFHKIPNIGQAAWEDLKRLRFGQVSDMLRLRATSLAKMATSIFMHRIRALGYGLIYKDKKYKGKRISNLVYHLLPGRKFFFADWPDVPKPTTDLNKVVETAAKMPTTLWFDKDKPWQQPCLVATGQATICYNLMKFIARNNGKNPNDYPPDIRDLWDRLLADWTKMVADPYVFLEERLPGEHLQRPPGSGKVTPVTAPSV